MTFSSQDLKFIQDSGRSAEEILKQFHYFETGFPFVQLVRPATLGDGIHKIEDQEMLALLEQFSLMTEYYRIAKFVPASGAASRMFKDLYPYLDTTTAPLKSKIAHFMNSLSECAFFHDLEQVMMRDGYQLKEMVIREDYALILEYLLTEKGLNYGNLPKALLKFHTYGDETRTALEEHLVEAARYAQNNDHSCFLHFTVSPAHQQEFEKRVSEVLPAFEQKFSVKYHISFSVQHPSTDTLAAEMDNRPFYDDKGSLLFRPGGHGALIYNLNQLKFDVIFIKNIDNVKPEDKLEETIIYKKILAAYLMQVQTQIHHFLKKNEQGVVTSAEKEEMIQFVEKTLQLKEITSQNLVSVLNRPIRVCGMVKNQGEPGGGPFWVKNSRGEESLQIVESAQIDMENSKQKVVFEKSTHFNPVDLVCSFKDFRGNYFNLHDYVDPDAGFISYKSYGNRKLKAMELPGLWNGAMSNWITLFIEVPLITFNPVKTVFDLLDR